ncbi:MAG: hypothetical protein Q9218_003425 [Villophora microphyllina]
MPYNISKNQSPYKVSKKVTTKPSPKRQATTKHVSELLANDAALGNQGTDENARPKPKTQAESQNEGRQRIPLHLVDELKTTYRMLATAELASTPISTMARDLAVDIRVNQLEQELYRELRELETTVYGGQIWRHRTFQEVERGRQLEETAEQHGRMRQECMRFFEATGQLSGFCPECARWNVDGST